MLIMGVTSNNDSLRVPLFYSVLKIDFLSESYNFHLQGHQIEIIHIKVLMNSTKVIISKNNEREHRN